MIRRMKPLRWAGVVSAAVSAGWRPGRASAAPIRDRASRVEGKLSFEVSAVWAVVVNIVSNRLTVRMILYPFSIESEVEGGLKIAIFRQCSKWTPARSFRTVPIRR